MYSFQIILQEIHINKHWLNDTVFWKCVINNFYRIDINKENKLAKMMLQLCRIACSQHGCIFLFAVFDRYTSRWYWCARAQLSKFPSWPQFWMKKSQNILKNCLKACWTTFSLKVFSTPNFLEILFFFEVETWEFCQPELLWWKILTN